MKNAANCLCALMYNFPGFLLLIYTVDNAFYVINIYVTSLCHANRCDGELKNKNKTLAQFFFFPTLTWTFEGCLFGSHSKQMLCRLSTQSFHKQPFFL